MSNALFSKIAYHFKNKTLLKFPILRMLNLGKKSVSSERKQNVYAQPYLNYKYDCSNPKTFNEYIGWIKTNYKNELWERCADKIKSKEFLEEIGLGDYVPKTLGVFRTSSEINIDVLPEKFVLKTNNDCGSVFICEKGKTDFKKVFSKLDSSLKRNYNNKTGEWVYRNIESLIFAEEYLEPAIGNDLCDYKLFVYSGKYKWGYVAQNRRIDLRITVFEDDFIIQDVQYAHLRPSKKNLPIKPKDFELMKKIAEKIGKHFGFVRVDFYETKKGLIIGELTFFSFSGQGGFSKYEYDLKYGQYFKNTPFWHEPEKEKNNYSNR